MSALVTKPAAEINQSMIKFFPELASPYAKYPMKHERWYDPTEKGPKGEPCYLPQGDVGVKADYAYCKRVPEGMNAGYFSLMSHVAYVNLYERLDLVRPDSGCCGLMGDREAADQWDDVKRVLWGRQLAAIPDDEVAGKAAIDRAKGAAQSVYTFTQNEALVVGAATTAIHLAG